MPFLELNMADYDLLRVEANPAQTWQELTEQQKLGLDKLLKMLDQAVRRYRELEKRPRKTKTPWLNYEKCSQLAFIDGKRGTGKSTLMATLVSLLVGGDSPGCDGNVASRELTTGASAQRLTVSLSIDVTTRASSVAA